MRWFLGFALFLGLALTAGFIALKGYPYSVYSQWVDGKKWNKYYSIEGYRPLLLASSEIEAIPPYEEDYVQLWKEFPIRNSMVPLPTRHPLFQTVPIINYKGKNIPPEIGLKILSPEGRDVSKLLTLPMSFYQDHSLGQELFKLPFVRNKINKKNLDELWAQIFSHKIVNRSKSLDEMIHDLFILHLRSKLLPAETIRYGMINDGKQALIELSSKDKDYTVELVMTQSNGSIYSYVVVTEKKNPESLKVRSKYLENINFTPADDAMARILYTEFKQLNFARQVDREGMLYLFSAWSQNPDNTDLLKEMIFYLERGTLNSAPLKILYEYAYKRYGKTFSTRKDFGADHDPELALQSKIELEDDKRRAAAEKGGFVPVDEQDLTPDEKMNVFLKKAKEEAPAEKSDMTIH